MPNINDKDIFRRKVDDFSDEFNAVELDSERWDLTTTTPVYSLDTVGAKFAINVDSTADAGNVSRATHLVSLPSASVE